MTFTVPKELYCVSNGRLLEVLDSPDETKRIFTWTVNNPINNYNISVQLGHYITIKDTIVRDSGIDTLTYYVLDYHEEIGKNHFKQSKDIIRFLKSILENFNGGMMVTNL